MAAPTQPSPVLKKAPGDFIFGKVVGEGSFSAVYLAKEVKTRKEFAIKVCDKQHIIREKKAEAIQREKAILTLLSAQRDDKAPFFVHLYATFQDSSRLYFVLTFAPGGELLKQLQKRKRFSLSVARFYAAEIVQALRHMHGLKIVHRDLKPENVLLTSDAHILITDFGSGKILDKIPLQPSEEPGRDPDKPVLGRGRSSSFVGTAQYVAPEVLLGRYADVGPAVDLWALGCIIYQFLTGTTPFQAETEFLIFRRIVNPDFSFPEQFDPDARDLVSNLLKPVFTERLGALDTTYYTSIQNHPFFSSTDFDSLHLQTPPLAEEGDGDGEPLRVLKTEIPEEYEPGYNPRVIAERFLHSTSDEDLTSPSEEGSLSLNGNGHEKGEENGECGGTESLLSALSISEPSDSEERETLLKAQVETEPHWHKVVEGRLILKKGIVSKKKGLFSRRRMLLLTEEPSLIYCDPVTRAVKGRIPWSEKLRPEAKDFKVFQIHTPERTYYLEDPTGYALSWCEAINRQLQRHGK